MRTRIATTTIRATSGVRQWQMRMSAGDVRVTDRAPPLPFLTVALQPKPAAVHTASTANAATASSSPSAPTPASTTSTKSLESSNSNNNNGSLLTTSNVNSGSLPSVRADPFGNQNSHFCAFVASCKRLHCLLYAAKSHRRSQLSFVLRDHTHKAHRAPTSSSSSSTHDEGDDAAASRFAAQVTSSFRKSALLVADSDRTRLLGLLRQAWKAMEQSVIDTKSLHIDSSKGRSETFAVRVRDCFYPFRLAR